MRYLPHTQDDQSAMLRAIGKHDLDDLFSSIPKSQQASTPLNIDAGLSEIELKTLLGSRLLNDVGLSFLGAGCARHFVPEIVSQMLLRSEWYTAYTPYQPEVAQGTLQAIFEFQTMVASLYGLDVANASMYDGATALTEACLMALRVHGGRRSILMSAGVHPEYVATCKTFFNAAGIKLDMIPFTADGLCDVDAARQFLKHANPSPAALVFQTPNFFGCLEHEQALTDLARQYDSLVIAANAEPVAYALMPPPGEYGADIVCGEGIGLCGHLSLGGPGVGLFATSKKYLRQMPGRLVGATVDKNERIGFTLTLSTREQHIRREKATSNICTNHSLMALAFTMTLSLYGKNGFKELAEHNLKNTILFRKRAKAAGLSIAFDGAHFNESVVDYGSEAALQKTLARLNAQKIFAGVPLSRFFGSDGSLGGHLLVHTSELHSEAHIDQLVQGLAF
jgi:glycine dehydrogenase subunit 1